MDYYLKVQKHIQRWHNIQPVLSGRRRGSCLINSRPMSPTHTDPGGVIVLPPRIHSDCPNTPTSPEGTTNPGQMFVSGSSPTYPSRVVRPWSRTRDTQTRDGIGRARLSLTLELPRQECKGEVSPPLSQTLDRTKDSGSASAKIASVRGSRDSAEDSTLWRQRLSQLRGKYAQVRDVNAKLSKNIAAIKANIVEISEVGNA